MSTAGVDFIQRWIDEHVPPEGPADADALAAQFCKDAEAEGLSPDDLEPEWGDPATLIREAIEHGRA